MKRFMNSAFDVDVGVMAIAASGTAMVSHKKIEKEKAKKAKTAQRSC